MEKVTIKSIFFDSITTKHGEKDKVSIFTEQLGDTRMSCFFNKGSSPDWKVGDEIMVEISKNGEYTNFKPVGEKTGGDARLEQLERRVEALEKSAIKEEFQTEF